MIEKIAFIGHPVKDLNRAKNFYGEVLGLKNTSNYENFWSEYDTPDGKTIALDAFSPPGSHVYLALETDDIDAEMARLKQQGVCIVKETWDNKVCKMALIADPEGNVLMLHQMAPERKRPHS